MDKSIGGYFELELDDKKIDIHQFASLSLNTGRNCLEYILRTRKYSRIYLPYFVCEAVLEPIIKIGLLYTFYELDSKLNPICNMKLNDDEVILYVNYFGLKQNMVNQLISNPLFSNIIVDNSQAFYAEPIIGNNIDTFYSARKFFGVSDGAYLYTNETSLKVAQTSESFDTSIHLLKRIELGAQAGFDDYQLHEQLLGSQPIMRISNLTKKIMCSIDYKKIKEKRRSNYSFLENKLSSLNKLSLNLEIDSVPMAYPYYTDNLELRSKLIRNKIFVAKYWPNISKWSEGNRNGVTLSEHIIPLPIDQRYGNDEMEYIIKIIKDGK